MLLMCPACQRMLTEMTLQQIRVDVCMGGCGGLWFDQGELRRMDEHHEAAGEALLEVELNPQVQVDYERRRRCPRCPHTLMLRHYWSIQKRVTVDECQTCAGYWLDDGELREIRLMYRTEAERKRAAMVHFSALFDERLEAERALGEAEREKLRDIARVLRFVTPSYYFRRDIDRDAE